VIQTNAAPAPSANSSEPTINAPLTSTNWVSIAPTQRRAPTNVVAQPPETSGPARQGALVIGGVLLVAAGALAALAVFRGRRTSRGSLISRSMRKD
jgi:hypothetical protein